VNNYFCIKGRKLYFLTEGKDSVPRAFRPAGHGLQPEAKNSAPREAKRVFFTRPPMPSLVAKDTTGSPLVLFSQGQKSGLFRLCAFNEKVPKRLVEKMVFGVVRKKKI